MIHYVSVILCRCELRAANNELQIKADVVPRECIRPELARYILPEVVLIRG